MRVLIAGVCGFVGSTLARAWVQSGAAHELFGVDNLIRPGSETNRSALKRHGVKLFHGDLRATSDLESLPAVDWVIDAAAHPNVLAGLAGRMTSRQLVEHNFGSTLNLPRVLQGTSRRFHAAQHQPGLLGRTSGGAPGRGPRKCFSSANSERLC